MLYIYLGTVFIDVVEKIGNKKLKKHICKQMYVLYNTYERWNLLIRNFKIVKVDYKYCDYLRMFDSKVSYNSSSKELRPFVGILFIVNGCEYFAPLSSPKIKHIHMKNNVDVVKIDNGNYGVVNFNNMIPVTSNNYELIDLNAAPKNTNELK